MDVSRGDHFLMSFDYDISPDRSCYKNNNYRDLKRVAHSKLQTKTASVLQRLDFSRDLLSVTCSYHNSITDLLNANTAVKSKKIIIVTRTPWFDREYCLKRKQRRKAKKTISTKWFEG